MMEKTTCPAATSHSWGLSRLDFQSFLVEAFFVVVACVSITTKRTRTTNDEQPDNDEGPRRPLRQQQLPPLLLQNKPKQQKQPRQRGTMTRHRAIQDGNEQAREERRKVENRGPLLGLCGVMLNRVRRSYSRCSVLYLGKIYMILRKVWSGLIRSATMGIVSH